MSDNELINDIKNEINILLKTNTVCRQLEPKTDVTDGYYEGESDILNTLLAIIEERYESK